MLLVSEAPGVLEISRRLMRLKEVEEPESMAGRPSLTSTDSVAAAMAMGKCMRASPEEVTLRCWTWEANPDASTRTAYIPIGTFPKRNSPDWSLMRVCDQSEASADKITFAPWTGRCPGS